jgi:hypothetical protein
MPRKRTSDEQFDPTPPEVNGEAREYEGPLPSGNEADSSDALSGMDFDVDDEYKPPPLIPKGTYHGVATKIVFQPSHYCIVWDWCLHDNGGVMSDGDTPIDGAHVFSRNWLPKPGDEDIMTKSGRNSKRQSKINMLKDFQDALEIDMSRPEKIATALAEQHWIGVEGDLDVEVEEYQGRFRNVVNRIRKSSGPGYSGADDLDTLF